MSDNAVHLVGNLTRPFELRFGPSGGAIASAGLAINTRTKDAQGNWEDGSPAFYDLVAFGSLAENVAESLDKGQRVVVAGRLNFSTWESAEGEKRSKVEVVVDALGPDLRWATVSGITKNEKRT